LARSCRGWRVPNIAASVWHLAHRRPQPSSAVAIGIQSARRRNSM